MDAEQALELAATYLKWWRDGTIGEAEPPEDIGEIIITLVQLADRLQHEPPPQAS